MVLLKVFRKDKTRFKMFSRASAERRTRNELQQHKIKSLSRYYHSLIPHSALIWFHFNLLPSHRHLALPSAMELSNIHDVVTSVDSTKIYSVFVSYIEIYNNCVYDLLEKPFYDTRGHIQQPSKVSY